MAKETSITSDPTKRILVLLEPDNDVRDALHVLLRGQGWSVELAGSLSELERYFAGSKVTAVISEARLPGCVAADILRTCQASNIPVVFTGHDVSVQGAVDLIRQGADDYLEKPFSRERLLDLLNRITNRHNDNLIPG